MLRKETQRPSPPGATPNKFGAAVLFASLSASISDPPSPGGVSFPPGNHAPAPSYRPPFAWGYRVLFCVFFAFSILSVIIGFKGKRRIDRLYPMGSVKPTARLSPGLTYAVRKHPFGETLRRVLSETFKDFYRRG